MLAYTAEDVRRFVEKLDTKYIDDITPPEAHHVRKWPIQAMTVAEVLTLETILTDYAAVLDGSGWRPIEEAPEGLYACTFDLTPAEAWQFWRQKYHDHREELTRLRAQVEQLKRERDALADDMNPQDVADVLSRLSEGKETT